MTVIEMGQELARRGLPALVWNMEELDAAKQDEEDDGGTVLRAHHNKEVTAAADSGIRFQACGGGFRVIRRKKGSD